MHGIHTYNIYNDYISSGNTSLNYEGQVASTTNGSATIVDGESIISDANSSSSVSMKGESNIDSIEINNL